MESIDVTRTVQVNFPDSTEEHEGQSVEVVLKDGSRKAFGGADFLEVLASLDARRLRKRSSGAQLRWRSLMRTQASSSDGRWASSGS